MKKEEYMGALRSALEGFDEELVQEIVNDYEERFRIGAERGKTEEQIIHELGSIKDLVEELGELQQGVGDSFQTNSSAYVTEQAWEEKVENGEEGSQQKKSYSGTGTSGTYYQEKTFAESFDSAMKKFSKVLDGVMKEAGRVIEGAAEQIEYHMEEAKKNHYYTYNGDGTCEGSEKEAEGTPNVEQSGQGTENCRKVIVDADIADVKVRTISEREPKAVCHYYSHKTAMMYPFYAKQEGDTFYVGVRRNRESEQKSGFFQFSMSPSIEIELLLPEGITEVRAESTVGDMELNEVKADELVLHTKNGDISANYVTCGRCSMEALSGDLSLMKSKVQVAELTAKSGDCAADRIEGQSFRVSTASGDIVMRSVQVAEVLVNTACGDISADALQGTQAKFHTASGDVNLNDLHGEVLEVVSASGDVKVQADDKTYVLKSQSGDVWLESRHDADVSVSNSSGDAEIRIVEALETYEVTMNSISGECRTYGQTKSESTVATKRIEAKTISGDVAVRFL